MTFHQHDFSGPLQSLFKSAKPNSIISSMLPPTTTTAVEPDQHTMFLDHFINAMQASSDAIQGLPLSRLPLWHVWGCNVYTFNPTLISTDAYIIIPLSTTYMHLIISISGPFSAIKNWVTVHYLFHTDIIFLHCHLHTCNSKTSWGRIMEIYTEV